MSRCSWAIGVLFLFAVRASAQTTGDLRGIITDPSGATVAGAKVTLTSLETGESRAVATDAEGRYAIPLLKIGEYSVAVEATGFRREVAQATVRSAEITALNLKLEVGQVTEQIEVTDAANPLDTQNAQVQQSFEARTVQEIPVGRNPNLLAATLPGIVPAPSGFNTGSFISHGNRARANNITIDNITATDVSVAGTGSSNNQPLNFSSIKEVKVITNTFSAEFGRNSGSQVQYVTKSGTNEFHGELYEYLQNSFFNARDWFDQTGQPTVTRQNQFGGVLGGPIIKNKTHFFVAGEGNPVRGAGAARIAQVPTASMIAQVTDPTSKKLLEQYQLPPATTDQGTFGTVQQNGPSFVNAYQWSVRVDHQFSDRDSLYARYGTAYNEGTNANNTFIGTNLANFGFISNNYVYSANLNETHIFSPNLISEFRSGFGRTSPIFDLLTTVPVGPRINFANAQISSFGQTDAGPQGRVQNTIQVGDSVTWIKGAHTIKFGGDFFRYQANSFLDSQTRGTYTFLSWDDFAAGRPSTYVQKFGSTVRGHRTWLTDMFVQDDYRVTPTFTVNLGFRYEIYGPTSEVNHLTSNLNFDCRASQGIAGLGPFGCFTQGLNATGINHMPEPRVGFAWNPKGGKTVIRAGYGIVGDFNYLNPITNQRALPPFVYTASLSGAPSFAGANSWASLVGGTAPIQAVTAAQVGAIRNDVLNYGDVNPVIDWSLKNPLVHQWTFGIERELPAKVILKVSYAGTKSNYLQRARQLNFNANRPAPATSPDDELARLGQFVASYVALTGAAQRPSGRIDPRFNVINYYDNSANSNYHALEVLATRQFRGGLSFQAAYTFGKSIDDVSDPLVAVPNDSTVLMDPTRLRIHRGVSGFDIQQRFVLTHVWELPWGNKSSQPFLKYLLGGWGFSGISSWRTGFPITLDAGARLGIPNISTLITGGVMWPNAAGPFVFDPLPAGSPGAPSGLTGDPIPSRRISSYAASLGLSQPLLGNFGTLGRNILRADGLVNYDWNVYKNTRISERIALQLRCEMYNVFNQHSFQDVTRVITSPSFGQYTTSAQSQRQLQLGAVLRF
jgi:outer membrane receptor protein involved in Fe transport